MWLSGQWGGGDNSILFGRYAPHSLPLLILFFFSVGRQSKRRMLSLASKEREAAKRLSVGDAGIHRCSCRISFIPSIFIVLILEGGGSSANSGSSDDEGGVSSLQHDDNPDMSGPEANSDSELRTAEPAAADYSSDVQEADEVEALDD